MKDAKTINQRFLSTVILPTTFLSVFVILAVAYFTLKVQHDSYVERFETSWHSVSYALSASVWTYDLTAIESTIESFARVWDVAGIQVFDQYGSMLGSVGKIGVDEDSERVLPMYGDGMSKIGEVRLWLPSAQAITQNFLPTVFITTLLVGLLMLFSGYLFCRAMKKQIHNPLAQTSTLLELQGFDALGHRSLKAMPEEIRQIAESISCNKKYSYERIESLKADLKREANLVNALQSLLSESDQTCIVLSDVGEVLIKNISPPFSQLHLPVLLDIVSNAIDPIEGLLCAGFEVHRVFTDREGGVVASYEIVASTGETLMVKILRLQKSSHALVAYNVSHAKWSDVLVDELLSVSKSGLAIFDRAGRLQMEKGESVARLLANYQDQTEINLAQILLEFPKIGTNTENGSVSFEHKISDDMIYRVHFSQHEQSGIGITHHNITEERKVELHLIESQRLNDLGRITSGVAHDFNNSLGVVIGQLELASGSTEHSDKTHHIEIALSAAKQSVNVVKQLMTYSRKQPQETDIVQFDNVLSAQRNVFQTAVGVGVKIHYDLAFAGTIYLDVELLISALLNLFINASDAMEGKGSIYVTTRRNAVKKGGRKMFLLTIQDTGPGVSSEIQKEIFLPFFTTKKNNVGNGLGLSMVQGFVDQLTGHISVENNEIGACFTLFLPEYQATQVAQSDNTDTKVPLSSAPQVHQPDSILVMVDDNELLLETHAQLLRIQNVKVAAFHDCRKAINFIEKTNNLGCVMVDMKMPQMSGLEFVEQISPYISKDKIILYSGNFDKHDIALARKKGLHKVLRKPLTAKQTLDAVQSCIAVKPRLHKSHTDANMSTEVGAAL